MSDNLTPNTETTQFTPHSNILCCYRLNCGAKVCPEYINSTEIRPKCKVEKYNHYQPDFDSGEWYDKSWDDLNKITWYDVVTLKESWIYLLILIIIAVFLFFCAILLSLYSGRV